MESNTKWMEDEANYFAMCLLMPADLVRREVSKLEWDLGDDKAIKQLAKTFDVSITAMSVRLGQLHIFSPYNYKK